MAAMTETKNAVVSALPADPVRASIEALKEEQAKLKAKKKELAAAMRSAQRKQARLRQRARQMTDEDLVAVLMMRKKARTKVEEPLCEVQKPSSGSAPPSSHEAVGCTVALEAEDDKECPREDKELAEERRP